MEDESLEYLRGFKDGYSRGLDWGSTHPHLTSSTLTTAFQLLDVKDQEKFIHNFCGHCGGKLNIIINQKCYSNN